MDETAAASKLMHIRLSLRKAPWLRKQIKLVASSTSVFPYAISVVKAAITILNICKIYFKKDELALSIFM